MHICVCGKCFVLVPPAAAAQGPQAKGRFTGQKSFDGFPGLAGITKQFSPLIMAPPLFLFGDENRDMVQIYSFNIYL